MLEGRAYIDPIIRARKSEMERYGNDWQNRPVRTHATYMPSQHHSLTQKYQNDLLQWYIDQAVERKMPDEAVTPRVFLVIFGAIHTSSLVLASLRPFQYQCSSPVFFAQLSVEHYRSPLQSSRILRMHCSSPSRSGTNHYIRGLDEVCHRQDVEVRELPT